MKIQPGYYPLNKTLTRGDTSGRPAITPSFGDFLQQQDNERTNEELQRKLEEIHVQGERLTHSMTVREFKLYRHMVKAFLEDTVRRGVGLKETKGWDRRGRGKRYKLLDEVDTLLVAMGEELLQSEEGRIELLSKVGEIRGMLINIVF
jgi:uncharacterized protein YaaR (DUF327 family)